MNVTPQAPRLTPHSRPRGASSPGVAAKQLAPARQAGVVLLEALIAIMIFSMGILAVIGLQAAMIKNTSDAKYRADASFIAQQRLAEIWVHPNTANTYLAAAPGADISNLLPNGTITVTQPVLCQFEVIVSWQQPGDSEQHSYTTVAQINGRLPIAAGAC